MDRRHIFFPFLKIIHPQFIKSIKNARIVMNYACPAMAPDFVKSYTFYYVNEACLSQTRRMYGCDSLFLHDKSYFIHNCVFWNSGHALFLAFVHMKQ
jgi:hypothetical protein